MNHALVKLFQKKLDNLTVSDYNGLNSPGLTCYLNSVLQVLFMTEDFREAVKRCCSTNSTTLDPHLGRLFADLQKKVAKTHDVTKKLGITNIYEQRDAAEYFEKILCLTSLEAAKMFKGELNHKTACLNCKERSDSKSFFWTLPLAAKDLCGQTYSVEKGLKAFFKGETVRGDNKMYCNRCNQKQDADFGCELTQQPEILTLLLKKFSFDCKRGRYVKLHRAVDVPQMLHVKNCKYELYAIVHHFGNLTGGHYTAQIKSFENQTWYDFNDDIVKTVRPPLFGAGDKSVRSRTAYLLMFKVSRTPGKTDEGDHEALCADSCVEAEGRHGEAEAAKALVPHHRLKDESCSGEENSKHLKQPNQRPACVRPRQIMLPRTYGATDGVKPSAQTHKPKSAELQADRGQECREPNRQQLDPDSKERMWHRNTRGSPPVQLRTHYGDCMLKRNPETHCSIVAKAGPAASTTRNALKLAEAEVVKNKMDTEVRRGGEGEQRREADVSEVYHSDSTPFHVSSNSCPSSVPHLKRHLQSELSTKAPNLCRKSMSPKRDTKMQRVCSRNVETTQAERERTKRNPAKVDRELWR